MNDVSAKETVQFKKPAIKPRKSTARHSVPNGSTGNEEESSRATTNERYSFRESFFRFSKGYLTT